MIIPLVFFFFAVEYLEKTFLANFCLQKVHSSNCEIKIPHTGNTRPSRKCVIQKYRYYTMSLSQYHGCCQYHKSMSIPWVFANTMSPCLYHESMSKPWVHVCTISLIIYHESMSIPWVFVNTMSPCLHHESRSSNYRNTKQN